MEVKAEVLVGDCRELLRGLPDCSVHCCVTSPPYFGLRDYGNDAQIGLEQTPEAYVAELVAVFREVRRVLRDDGTVWLNLGDSYFSSTKGTGGSNPDTSPKQAWKGSKNGQGGYTVKLSAGDLPIKHKDLIGIPWRVAFALQADGWWLRQDIIWCLSGGTVVYAKTQKGEMPTTIKDLARLDPSTVKLWNGSKWTQLLGVSKSGRKGDEIEIVLRSGERISCTPTHKFPTDKGLIDASKIKIGDVLNSCSLPEPENIKDCAIDEDAAWLAGLYLAEGSISGNQRTIQIAGHAKESERWDRVQKIAHKYGGTATRTLDGNNMSIRIYGRILHAIIDELVNGKTAHDKGFSPVVWKYSNKFIGSMLDGYLHGDGHKDGDRWRLGFCRNYNLERDLRTACARLGYSLTLNMSSVAYNGSTNPTFRGEIRKSAPVHCNSKNKAEVVEVRKARARQFYDIGVDDEPHLFALASGILTHNSKPNPMPESVTDRCTKAHEYIFLLSKSAKYYYDAEAVKVPVKQDWGTRNRTNGKYHNEGTGLQPHGGLEKSYEMANRRSVWTVSTKPYKGAHFATFPPDLILPCVLAGCPVGGTVLDPFNGSGTTGLVALQQDRNYIGCELNPDYVKLTWDRIGAESRQLRLF